MPLADRHRPSTSHPPPASPFCRCPAGATATASGGGVPRCSCFRSSANTARLSAASAASLHAALMWLLLAATDWIVAEIAAARAAPPTTAAVLPQPPPPAPSRPSLMSCRRASYHGPEGSSYPWMCSSALAPAREVEPRSRRPARQQARACRPRPHGPSESSRRGEWPWPGRRCSSAPC